jgi:hypothetical protein
MKYLALILLFLVPGLASADDASHHAAAVKLIETIGGKEVMRNAFAAVVDSMPASKMWSAAQNAEMKQAVFQWFDEDFKWEDLSSQLADIYTKALSEDEINQLIAFYQTPLGKKTLSVLPEVMKEASVMGQQYAASKQGLLMARLQKVESKYEAGGSAPATQPAQPQSAPIIAPLR